MRYLDSLIVAVRALSNYLQDGFVFEAPKNEKGVCGMGKAKPWILGETFLHYMLNVSSPCHIGAELVVSMLATREQETKSVIASEPNSFHEVICHTAGDN